MNWQPIDSAPKNEYVLVLCEIASVEMVHLALWDTDELNLWDSQGLEHKDEAVGWWYYVNSVTQAKLEGIEAPKYWLPKPGGGTTMAGLPRRPSQTQ